MPRRTACRWTWASTTCPTRWVGWSARCFPAGCSRPTGWRRACESPARSCCWRRWCRWGCSGMRPRGKRRRRRVPDRYDTVAAGTVPTALRPSTAGGLIIPPVWATLCRPVSLPRIPMTQPTLIRETFPVGPLQCNCTLIGDPVSKKALVVDPGGEPEMILARLNAHGLTLAAIIHTHAHLDHFLASGKLKELTGATLHLHKDDKFLWDNLEM